MGLLALAGCKSARQEPAALQPNVIYVFPDQYRNHAMEFWGQEGFREHVNFRNDPVHTPRLNDFARESLVLTSAQSNCPLSSPHRGILLTGMYPNKSGVPLNCHSNRPISSLRQDAECVSDVFSKAGYDCAYFGKLQFLQITQPHHLLLLPWQCLHYSDYHCGIVADFSGLVCLYDASGIFHRFCITPATYHIKADVA